MIKYNKLFFFILALLIFFACDLFESYDYYPLTVDNEWEYIGYTFFNTDTIYKNLIIVKVTAKHPTENVYTVKTDTVTYRYLTGDTVKTSSDVRVVEIKDAIVVYSDRGKDTILKYPLKKDNTWKVYFYNDTITYKVIGQEDVTVPSGNYQKVWKISQNWKFRNVNPYFYYADKVGLVKYDLEFTRNDTTFKTWFNLTKATIK